MKNLVAVVCMTATIAASMVVQAVAAEDNLRPRVIVTTDGEADDRCSMIRFLLYANDWDIRGLIHSSSKHHWKGNQQTAGKKWHDVVWLDKQLEAYEAVLPNLKLHAPGYPTADYLRSQIFVGNIELEGDIREPTAGSDRIVEVLLEKNSSPVWLQAWGGPNTIARALKTISEKYPERVAEVSAKAKIYLISQQDNTYKNYIRKQWPDVDVLLSNYDAYGAIAYGWGRLQPPDVKTYFGRVWMRENILQNHGPLLDMYEHKELRFRSEGDSPAFLHTINTGLRSLADPSYGGWGGRFRKAGEHYWKSVDGKQQDQHSILRWAIDFQNDWAARADWCVKNYEQANHPPEITLENSRNITAKPGQTVSLAAMSKDPDGDQLDYRWWHHMQPSTCKTSVVINGAEKAQATITVPSDVIPGETLHIICEVTDHGSPKLTRYQRVIVTCHQ